ncbi:MAG: helix-turn-helix domain-containing protein [Tannerella sp.]|nr:helix-turn-helix domain-containing protein [Tannerella sp.]
MTRIKEAIKRVCEYCGKEFIAGTSTTRYCSPTCNKRAYKATIRQKKIDVSDRQTINTKTEKMKKDFANRQAYSVAEVAEVLGVCKKTIYNLAHAGKIFAIRKSSRMTVIPEKSINEFLESVTLYEVLPTKKRKPIEDWYSLEDITEKYGLQYRQIRKIINTEHLPEKKNGRITLVSKNHVDRYFEKRSNGNEIDNLAKWLTMLEVMSEYGMTTSAAYSFLSLHNIPKKRMNGKMIYSKQYIDTIKNKGQ